MTKIADVNMEKYGKKYGDLQNNSMMRVQDIIKSHLYKTTL